MGGVAYRSPGVVAPKEVESDETQNFPQEHGTGLEIRVLEVPGISLLRPNGLHRIRPPGKNNQTH